MIRHVNMGARVKDCVKQIPVLDVEASIQPITRTVLRVVLKILGTFKWNDRAHGKTGEPFWIWIEDPDTNHIYHSEYFMMHKKHVSCFCSKYLSTLSLCEWHSVYTGITGSAVCNTYAVLACYAVLTDPLLPLVRRTSRLGPGTVAFWYVRVANW